jgi:hypothetical protein
VVSRSQSLLTYDREIWAQPQGRHQLWKLRYVIRKDDLVPAFSGQHFQRRHGVIEHHPCAGFQVRAPNLADQLRGLVILEGRTEPQRLLERRCKRSPPLIRCRKMGMGNLGTMPGKPTGQVRTECLAYCLLLRIRAVHDIGKALAPIAGAQRQRIVEVPEEIT